MPAITIFCHGTNSFTDERTLDPVVEAKGELVQLLEQHFRLPDEQQHLTLNGGKLLLQGVGSHGHDPRHSSLVDDGETLAMVDRSSLVPAWARVLSDKASEIGHTLGGAGIGANIAKAVTFLKAMQRDGMAPDSITMVGWSRGAVTCVRLAQALDEAAPDIPVHIFAGDPVPGFGRHEGWRLDKQYTITANVRTFLHVIAMDVHGAMGPLFRPLLPGKVAGADTVVAMLPMPGNHSEVVMTEKGDPGKLTMDLAIRFMALFDSAHLRPEFVENRKLSMEDIARYYNGIMAAVSGGSGAFPISSRFQQGGGMHHRPGQFSHLTQYTGASFASDFQGGRYVNDHHRYIAGRTGDLAALQDSGDPEDFGLRALLSRMYS